MVFSREGQLADEDGFSLVPVLLIVAFVTTLAFLYQRSVRLDLKTVERTSADERAQSVADGLTKLVAFRLTSSPVVNGAAGPLRVDGTPFVCVLGNRTARIRVDDADGLVNLNMADPVLIEKVAVAVGFERQAASRLAAAIIGFRSEGTLDESGHEKVRAYQSAGLAHGPRLGSFVAVDELDQVLGMPPRYLDRLRPYLTVHGRSANIRLEAAGLDVLSAVTGGGAAVSTNLDALRDTAAGILPPPPNRRGPRLANSVVFRIDVAVGGDGFARRVATAQLGENGVLPDFREWARLPAPVNWNRPSEAKDCGAVLWGRS